MYVCCSYKWAIWGNLCKHQIAIILFTIDILESTLLEFCATYFNFQRGGLDVLFTTPFKDDLILASNDDGNGNDNYKDCEIQLHVDVGGCSQFPDENIPSGDGPLIVEMATNKSMTNQLMIVKAIAKKYQLGGQIVCDHKTIILHQVYGNTMHYDWLNLLTPFIQWLCLKRLMMAFLTPKKTWRIGVKNIPLKNVRASNYLSIIFVILAKAIVGNPNTSMNMCCFNGQKLCL